MIYFETGGGVLPPRWFVEGAGLVFLLTFILNGLEARPVQLNGFSRENGKLGGNSIVRPSCCHALYQFVAAAQDLEGESI